jgi:DNA-binding SARP family transcriptional activator
VRTLGRFDVEVGGTALAVRGKAARKPLELLQFVVACGSQQVAATSVEFSLWPDLDGDNAHAASKIALHRLRRLLGDDAAIAIDAGRLSLNPRLVWVDCLAFEALADALPVAPFGPAQQASAERVLALYAGPFLGSEDDHSWQLVHRERLASKYRRVVHAVVVQARAGQDLALARRTLERALELDPLDEDLLRELLQAARRQRRARRRARALRALAGALRKEPRRRAGRVDAGRWRRCCGSGGTDARRRRRPARARPVTDPYLLAAQGAGVACNRTRFARRIAMQRRSQPVAALALVAFACAGACAQPVSTDAQACGWTGCQENTGVLSASASTSGHGQPRIDRRDDMGCRGDRGAGESPRLRARRELGLLQLLPAVCAHAGDRLVQRRRLVRRAGWRGRADRRHVRGSCSKGRAPELPARRRGSGTAAAARTSRSADRRGSASASASGNDELHGTAVVRPDRGHREHPQRRRQRLQGLLHGRLRQHRTRVRVQHDAGRDGAERERPRLRAAAGRRGARAADRAAACAAGLWTTWLARKRRAHQRA